MTTLAAGGEPRLSEEEMQAMLPLVLELQRLVQERLQGGFERRDEVASISVTSCNHHSCN